MISGLIKRSAPFALTGLAALALSGCFGGGDDIPPLTIQGVAATGLAIDGGAVSVQCRSGTGTATTTTDGAYRVNVNNGIGPCLVSVTKNGVTLYGIAKPDTDGGVEVANVNPISSAIVEAIAKANGTTVDQLISSKPPSASDIDNAATAVVDDINEALVAAGWTGAPLQADQLLHDPNFKAAKSSQDNSGSPLDKALDKLVNSPGNATLPTDLLNKIKDKVKPNQPPTGATGGTGANG